MSIVYKTIESLIPGGYYSLMIKMFMTSVDEILKSSKKEIMASLCSHANEKEEVDI